MSFAIPEAYELIETKEIPEIMSTGYLLSHKKTGARVLCVENSDENKVFSIGFRTTPKDSTGVAHIIEHTVLCGSDKYPAKDPFVELVKGSLNTFLNAMTYPDKTLYPLASCNDQDFKNLMSVYMDAVFHPNIYKNRMLFEQEGWHYEMEDETSPLIYNGVVYNEMKGAYSSPDDVLVEEIQKGLFPDNDYSNDSGGYPVDIPNLTYEKFLEFHRTYYHPSNSFIYLYGNCDMTERLRWMDEEYLGHYERIEVDSLVSLQKPFESVADKTAFYSIGEDESEENNAYLAYARSVGNGFDMAENMAYALLEYVLLEAPGAPVKQALIDAHIGADVYGFYDDNCRQPYFAVIAKGANVSDYESFVKIIEDTLKKLAADGISKKSLLAGLNGMEFKAKEADFGYYPKGLMYGLDCLTRWLYDDRAAFETLAFQETFDKLRKLVGTDYFEKLIENKLLLNTHGANICLAPKRGYVKEMEDELKNKLASVREGLSEAERREIVEHTKALKQFQDTPSTQEELEMIPMLSRDDVKKEAAPYYNREKQIGDTKVVWHDLFTGGISYADLAFDAKGLTFDEVPYAALLQIFFGMVNTKNFSYKELSDEILIKTGGIAASTLTYRRENEESHLLFNVSFKVLPAQLADGISLVKECMFNADYTDKKRLKELVSQAKARLSSSIMERGDLIATTRAASYYSEEACLADKKGGVDFYFFLDELDTHFDERADELIDKIHYVASKLFVSDNLLVSFTGNEDLYKAFDKESRSLFDELPDIKVDNVPWNIKPEAKNEGFKTASQVNYVARCGNYKLIDPKLKFTGTFFVLKVWMSYEYLWVNVRVKGGAYGCFGQFLKKGDVKLASYRDPKVRQTNEVFEKAADAVSKIELTERDLTKYILGAINEIDTPCSPAKKGSDSFLAYLLGTTEEDVQGLRDQVLSTTVEDLRALSKLVGLAIDEGYICAVGNATQLEEDKDLFKTVKNIFH